MVPIELRSERLLLSVPTPDDVDAITEYCQDPLFERYLTTPWPYRPSDAEWFVGTFVPRGWADESEFTWAIRSIETEQLLGVIGWRSRGDVGFWMGAPHRGQGYMTEALATVVEWVFVDRGAEQIEWESVVGNLGSARVARAVGFEFTGIGPSLLPVRDASEAWHGVLTRSDDREVKSGWPL